MFFKVYQLPFFFKCALRSGGIREKWTRSNGDRSWCGQNLHQKEKENYKCYELHSFVITQREIPKWWLGKISRKDAFIYSHRLTGFPVEGGNPWPWEKIRGTRVAIVLLREHSKNDSLITFYSGFPNMETMRALDGFKVVLWRKSHLSYLSHFET